MMKWTKVKDYQDIVYEKVEGIAKVTINRPEKRNAFRPTNSCRNVRGLSRCA